MIRTGNVNASQEMAKEAASSQRPAVRQTEEASGAKLQGAQQRNPVVNREELETAVDGLNTTLDAMDRGLKFSIHDETNRVMVKVVDRTQDDEVIREIPPEKVLDMVAELRKLIGLLLDQKI